MEIGDRITFKSATRYSFKKATRVVTHIDNLGRPWVRYAGWNDFIVRFDEILEVIKP